MLGGVRTVTRRRSLPCRQFEGHGLSPLALRCRAGPVGLASGPGLAGLRLPIAVADVPATQLLKAAPLLFIL